MSLPVAAKPDIWQLWLREGFRFLGIEQDAEHAATARLRIEGDAPLLNAPAEILPAPNVVRCSGAGSRPRSDAVTRPRYGVMSLEERRHVSVTLWCHACGKPTTSTDYDAIWGDCFCGGRCWGTWPKGETAQEGDFSVAPEGVRLW